jgi:hypothetical protein
MPLDVKAATADHVLDTSGCVADTQRRADELLKMLCLEWGVDSARYGL